MTTVKPRRRVFLAHSKNDPQEVITEMIERVPQLIVGVDVTTARDEYARSAARLRNWDAWTHYVATGRVYGTAEPLYHAFVVPRPRMGRATADICRLAIQAGKRVFILEEDGLAEVARIATSDAEDYQNGWVAVPAGHDD